MDGTLGSQTAWMLDGSGVQITSGEELAEIVRRGAAAGFPVAVHAIGDRANREALDAFEQTRDALAAARPAPAHRARAAARARGSRPASPSSASPCSVQFSHAPSDRDLADGTGPARPTAPTRSGRCSTRAPSSCNGSDAPIEELDPLAGIRAGVRRTIDERPAWHPEQALTVDQAFHATCVAPAWLARRRAAPRHADSRPATPTSSCSTATRGTTSTRRSSRRWSPAAGCTTRRPGTRDRVLRRALRRKTRRLGGSGAMVELVRP